MTMTLKAAETARRNLAQRLERYLAMLEKREAQPGRREGDHLLRALAHLQTGTFADGEREMMWAEWASRQADAEEAHPTATAQVLRQRLDAILEE